jgi:hypothetical protein
VTARAWHGVIAILVVLAIAIQVWVAIDAPAQPAGHAVGTLAGVAVPWRILRVFSFFTVQSNIVSGVVSWQLARRPGRDGPVWRVARLDALFGITVTGVVYSTVLAKIHEPHGWRETSSNLVVHYAVPILMVLGWLLFGPRPRITGRLVCTALIWPVAYFGYALIVGAVSKWYPYPFVDAATHGYGRVLLNAVAVTAVFAVVASLFWLGDRRLRAAPHHVRRVSG